MGSSAPQPPINASDYLREIDSLVSELHELAQSHVEPDLFYTQLLERAAIVLKADAAAVWDIGSHGGLTLSYQKGMNRLHAGTGDEVYPLERARLLPHVQCTQAETFSASPETNLNSWGIVSPISVGDRKYSLLAIYLVEELPLAVKQGFQRFVQELARIASDYEQHRNSANWQLERVAWKNYAELSLSLQRTWSLQELAYEIANEGRRYIDCDRVAVVLDSGRRSRLSAISGVDALHRHANVVRKLEELVDVALPLKQPLIIEGKPEDLPPQIELRLQEYLDEGATQSIAVVPLFHPTDKDADQNQQPFGALVFEQFEQASLHSMSERIQLLCEQSELGLSRAVRIREIPLLGFLVQNPRLYSWLRVQAWPVWATVLGVFVLVLGFLTLFPADFNLEAQGELEPINTQHVFATQDGTVSKVLVENDQHVDEGELLVELSSTDLDLEFQRVSGEMLVAQKELSAVRAEQLQTDDFDAQRVGRLQELSARESAIEEQISNLSLQLGLITEQRKELKVNSPLSGRILTWDVSDNLLARPVRRGDVLMTVADVEDAWVVRLLVPDSDMGHLLSAVASSEEDVPVSFVLVADPGKTHQGTIKRVGGVSQVDYRRQANAVMVEVEINAQSISQLRSGASVVSKIYCGRRSIGFVWLREFLEECNRNFF